MARGFDTIAHACLREARRCYLRWGAAGKVRNSNSFIRISATHQSLHLPPPTIGTPTEQLDVGTVLKAAQAVSGEIVLGKLIEALMRITLEHAGADVGYSSCSKATSHGSRRKRRPAAARLRSRCAKRPRHRPSFPKPCSTT